MLKHVRVFEKSRTCLKKFMYVFFYKMIGIQLYMFKSYNNSTLQGFVIKDIADIYRVSKKRLKCDSKRRWGTMKIRIILWNSGSNCNKREQKRPLFLLDLFDLLKRFSEHIRDVAGDHALFRAESGGEITGCAVQEYSDYSGSFRRIVLRQ